jgi:hypothetical protein
MLGVVTVLCDLQVRGGMEHVTIPTSMGFMEEHLTPMDPFGTMAYRQVLTGATTIPWNGHRWP